MRALFLKELRQGYLFIMFGLLMAGLVPALYLLLQAGETLHRHLGRIGVVPEIGGTGAFLQPGDLLFLGG